jgi:hypothetical protein
MGATEMGTVGVEVVAGTDGEEAMAAVEGALEEDGAEGGGRIIPLASGNLMGLRSFMVMELTNGVVLHSDGGLGVFGTDKLYQRENRQGGKYRCTLGAVRLVQLSVREVDIPEENSVGVSYRDSLTPHPPQKYDLYRSLPYFLHRLLPTPPSAAPLSAILTISPTPPSSSSSSNLVTSSLASHHLSSAISNAFFLNSLIVCSAVMAATCAAPPYDCFWMIRFCHS